MSKENRVIREELSKIYGDGCFFERGNIAEKIEEMGGIKTYKKFLEEKRFTSKHRIRNRLTLHHLKHRSEGGETSLQNGANVREIPHQYLHSLPREQEEIINDMLRDFKASLNVMDLRVSENHIDIKQVRSKVIDQEEDYLIIPAFDNTEKIIKKKNKFNRNKEKKKTKKIIERYYSEDEGR